MSVLSNNKENDNTNKNDNKKLLDYYNEYLPGVVPLALYRYTKFLTADKINGGLLTMKEINELNDIPTGYCFDLKDSGYFIIDVDMIDGYSRLQNFNLNDDDKELLNCKIDKFPDKIETNGINSIGKRYNCFTRDSLNIAFCEMFKTPFVKSASKGYHFYFKNDLTREQLIDIFGIPKSKYIKCISLFNEMVDLDIFLDFNDGKETRLVLPFSTVIIENKESTTDINTPKIKQVEYSGLRYYKCDDFRKASDLIRWLKLYITPLKQNINDNESDIDDDNNNDKYWKKRGRAINVSDSNRLIYLNQMEKNFKLIKKLIPEMHTYKNNPFNLYCIMCYIVPFPVCMHYDLLVKFIQVFDKKMSENCIKQLLTYYYQVATDKRKFKDWKGPIYLEKILNSRLDLDLSNKYIFEYENDSKNNDSEQLEEIIYEDVEDDPKSIIIKFNKEYSKFPLPSLI